MKKFIGVFVGLVIIFFAARMFMAEEVVVPTEKIDEEPVVIGGDRDEFGCLSGAGYSFDDEIDACVRVWEIDTDEKRRAAIIAVEEIGSENGLTLVDITLNDCSGCFSFNFDNKGERTSIHLENWVVVTVPDEDIIVDVQNPNEVPIENDFGTKIVYGADQNMDIEALRLDCAEREGEFSECGSSCAFDAEMCIDVCAFVCNITE